jgi:hypothetical protein
LPAAVTSQVGQNQQPIGRKKQDAKGASCDHGGRKESQMTEVDEATAPFVEAEIKEHQAALIRQMVAIGVIISVMLIWVGLHH